MSFLRKARALLHDDWCQKCTNPMELKRKQLYMLPTMTVGHFEDIEDPNYYVQNLVKISKKAEIPAGFYACGTYLYHCPHCNKDIAKLTVFLPVRDQEQVDGAHLFEDATFIDFLQQ